MAARATEVIKSRPELQRIKYWRIWQQNDSESDRSIPAFIDELGEEYIAQTPNLYWEDYKHLNKGWTDVPDIEQ